MNHWLWGWEIQSSGGGPHHYLTLKFAATAPELEQAVQPLLAQQFELWQGHNHWKSKGSGSGCYTLVELHAPCITVTRAWGNIDGTDTELLQQLLARLSLRYWQVIAGGEGYASKPFRDGSDLASFVDYCRGD